MAKRRMRRTRKDGSTERQSTTDALTDQAREMSVGAVKVATETARAALGGMQELGRVVAGMAAPAARQTVKTANELARATVQTARRVSRSAGPSGGGKGKPGKGRAA
jgi:hypothetical protein